jgi:hypothetical protein
MRRVYVKTQKLQTCKHTSLAQIKAASQTMDVDSNAGAPASASAPLDVARGTNPFDAVALKFKVKTSSRTHAQGHCRMACRRPRRASHLYGRGLVAASLERQQNVEIWSQWT